MIVHEKLEKQEKKQEIQEEEPEVEEQEKALEKKLTGKADKKDVSDQIAVFAVDINKKKEEFMPTKPKKRNKGWSVTEAENYIIFALILQYKKVALKIWIIEI